MVKNTHLISLFFNLLRVKILPLNKLKFTHKILTIN